jgi:hypothetical protein
MVSIRAFALAACAYTSLAMAGSATQSGERAAWTPFELPSARTAITAGVFSTDAACMNDCIRDGHQYAFCQSKCSFGQPAPIPPAFPRHGIDYKCMNDCTSRGSQYNFCKSQCSY